MTNKESPSGFRISVTLSYFRKALTLLKIILCVLDGGINSLKIIPMPFTQTAEFSKMFDTSFHCTPLQEPLT